MKTLFGCIADDFTGATDIAGILTRSGVNVNLRLGVPDTDSTDSPPAQFEIIALKCRTSPVKNAVEECLAALAWLKVQGARRFFWKYCSTFDSTPSGNIGPVAEALLQSLGSTQTIYCTAFPENGRSIYMGYLFAGEQLLHESPMKDHPLTPMRDSNLVRLLQPQVTSAVRQITLPTVRSGAAAVQAALEQLDSRQIRHVIVDAVESDDLATIVQATSHLQLLTGGSALAIHLPDLYRQQGLLTQDQTADNLPSVDPGQIVLSGSCSSMTRRQVNTYQSTAHSFMLDPIALASGPEVLKNLQDRLRQIPPEEPKLVYATADPDSVQKAQSVLGTTRAGDVVEHAMAILADVAFETGVRRFVIAGGETSGAVTQRLGIRQLRVGQEIAPGVPWTYGNRHGETVAMALKSGNFGNENFFQTALSLLP